MDQRTIGIYLSRILSGFLIFLYKGRKYKLAYPNINIKYEADIYALEAYENNKYNDWILEDEIINILVNIGLWTYNGDSNLKNLEKQIEDLKVDLYKNFLNATKVKSIKRNLSNIKNAYNTQYDIRHSLDTYTVSGYVQSLKNQYILIHTLYDNQDNILFPDIKNIDSLFLNNLANTIISYNIDINQYRSIARSEQWKNYWSANSENIFDKSTVNWTDEQKTLVVFTKMYDSASQHPECPPDSVFEDDDMFDGWLLTQRRESEKARNKNRTEKALGDKLSKANEVFIAVGSKEEANSIYDLNDDTSKHIIRERNAILKSTNTEIEDSKLPDVQRNLVMQANEAFKNSRKK